MSRRLLTVLMCCIVTLPALAALPPGAQAPDFTTQASLAGKSFTFTLKDALKKGPVVVYFYPAAFTRGCNLQAHTFAEQMADFTSAGATVIGVSLDRIETLNEFSADPQYCAGKLAVASDADGRIAKNFDIKIAVAQAGLKNTRGAEIDHGFAERTTFVVGVDDKIVATIGGMSPKENVEKTLDVVRQLSGTQK
jgi:thioredoxin-dependent peroxiredoxin